MRRVRIALVLLLLGAGLNVAVAYACVLWVPSYVPAFIHPQLDPWHSSGWICQVPEGWPRWEPAAGVELDLREHRWFGMTVSSQDLTRPLEMYLAIPEDAGLPFRALRCSLLFSNGSGEFDLIGGWYVPPWLVRLGAHTGRALPYTVLPAGFAANTAFYAGLVGLAWYGPGLVRRHRRARRGQCLDCGYDRAGLAPALPCPECGRPGVPPARTLD